MCERASTVWETPFSAHLRRSTPDGRRCRGPKGRGSRCEAARAAIRFWGQVREYVLKCTIAPGFDREGDPSSPSFSPCLSSPLPLLPFFPVSARGPGSQGPGPSLRDDGPQSATYLLCFCKLGPLHSTIIKLSKFGTHNLLRSLVLMRFSLLKPVSQTTELVTHKKTLMRNVVEALRPLAEVDGLFEGEGVFVSDLTQQQHRRISHGTPVFLHACLLVGGWARGRDKPTADASTTSRAAQNRSCTSHR